MKRYSTRDMLVMENEELRNEIVDLKAQIENYARKEAYVASVFKLVDEFKAMFRIPDVDHCHDREYEHRIGLNY